MKKSILYITLGSFLVALGINFFLLPEKISTGGVSGIGTILFYSFSVPLSVTTLVLNLILIIFAFKYLTKEEIIKTVLGIVLCSAFLEILPVIQLFNDDRLISSLCGGVTVGAGLGLVISVNASTGGSDLAAVMINKLCPFLSVTYIIFIIDAIIIAVSGIVFKDFVITFYSVLTLYIAARVADIILVKGDFAKSVFIISKNCDEISEIITSKLERGVTGIYGKGMYLKEDKTILLCVLKPKEIPDLKKAVYSIDENAFIVISEAREVIGEGFKNV